MARATACRLRERSGAEEFAFACDHVLTPPGTGRFGRPKPDWRKVTDGELIRRLQSDRVQPVIFRGRMVAVRRKPEDSVLLRLLRRDGGLPSNDGAE